MEKNHMNKLVSVVIPTYKREVETLSKAVNSIANQTYKNIEIVIIDDSPDTYEKRAEVKAYVESLEFKKTIYIQNEKNLGGSLARNLGIDASTGEYITFLDDDDEYKPEKIEKQLRFMQKNDYDMTFTPLEIYTSDEKLVDYRDFSDIESFDNNHLLKYHLQKHLTGTPTFMYKAEKLREIGGFDVVKVGQEFHLMLKSIIGGLKIGYFPECHVKAYRHPDGGISGGMNKINGEKALFEFKHKYFDRLNKKEQRFVKFRHHAVLAAGYKRNNMYLQMMSECFKTVLSSPTDFINEGIKYINKLNKHK